QRQDPPEDCVWEPSAVEWERIQAGSQAEWIGAQKNTIGQPQPQAMQSAVNRGVHPAQRAPAPTLVRMRAFPKAAKILLAVDLKHARGGELGKSGNLSNKRPAGDAFYASS